MTTVHYEKRLLGIECARISEDNLKDGIALAFENEIEGTVKLSGVSKKINGKLCIFNTGEVKEGFHFPKIYLKSSIIELEGFEFSHGKLKLIKKDDSYVRGLSAEIFAIREELSKIKEELSRHDEKINGHPIF